MPYKHAVKRVCPCGAEFETKSPTRTLCDACAKARKKAWDRDYGRWYHATVREKKSQWVKVEEPYPVRVVPCAGCGRDMETRCRHSRVFCDACKDARRRDSQRRYKAETGKWQTQEWAAKNRDKQREYNRRWYEKNKEKVAAMAKAKRAAEKLIPRPAKPKPERPKVTRLVASKPRKVAPVKTTAPGLPTEAEKMAMIRAAMRRVYGE